MPMGKKIAPAIKYPQDPSPKHVTMCVSHAPKNVANTVMPNNPTLKSLISTLLIKKRLLICNDSYKVAQLLRKSHTGGQKNGKRYTR